jgi:hypothetical protein
MNILKFKITDKFFFSETKKEIRFFQAGRFLWRRKTEAPSGSINSRRKQQSQNKVKIRVETRRKTGGKQIK